MSMCYTSNSCAILAQELEQEYNLNEATASLDKVVLWLLGTNTVFKLTVFMA